MVDQVPELIEVALIARSFPWPTRKTRKFLTACGMAGSGRGRGRDTLVSRDAFASQLPKIYKSFREKYLAGKLRSKRGGHHPKSAGKE
jgi:hypothetical protein